MQALLAATGRPLAAPSANASGRISPTRAAHVLASLSDRIALVIDGGATQRGIESTIVAVTGGPLRLLRRGPIEIDAAEATATGDRVAWPARQPLRPAQAAPARCHRSARRRLSDRLRPGRGRRHAQRHRRPGRSRRPPVRPAPRRRRQRPPAYRRRPHPRPRPGRRPPRPSHESRRATLTKKGRPEGRPFIDLSCAAITLPRGAGAPRGGRNRNDHRRRRGERPAGGCPRRRSPNPSCRSAPRRSCPS